MESLLLIHIGTAPGINNIDLMVRSPGPPSRECSHRLADARALQGYQQEVIA